MQVGYTKASHLQKADRYATKAHLYPNAEYYTFYNGNSPYPAYKELKLSDLFIDKAFPFS